MSIYKKNRETFEALLADIEEEFKNPSYEYDYDEWNEIYEYIRENLNSYYSDRALVALSMLNDLMYSFSKYPNDTAYSVLCHTVEAREKGGDI